MCGFSGYSVSPVVEKSLSLGIEEACTHKYKKATSDSKKNVVLLLHHQAAGSSDVIVGAISLYIYSALSVWMEIDICCLEGFPKAFTWRPFSTAENSSNGAIKAFLCSCSDCARQSSLSPCSVRYSDSCPAIIFPLTWSQTVLSSTWWLNPDAVAWCNHLGTTWKVLPR